MKVLLQVPLSTYSGYGNDGCGLARAFMHRGADVYLDPTAVQAPLPLDVASLLTKENKAPFDLTIQHVDPITMKSDETLKAVSGVYIGWSMWESSNFGNLPRRSTLKKRLRHFDAVVGYDDVSAECFQPYYKKPILKQQGGYWPEDWAPLERDWDRPEFHFAMIGVLSPRKDPFAAIHAFTNAKAEDPEFDKYARLSLKTSVPGLHSKMEDVYPGLRVFYDSWPTEVVKEFYRAQHVLLAPSRGEGKNMPALEFMSTGGAVIASNWGGHREWLNPDYSYPLDVTLHPVDEAHPGTLNARADVEHLKNLMLHTFHHREEVRRKGQRASQIIPQMCSWDRVVDRLINKIRTEVSGGERLWMLDSLIGQEYSNASVR